MFEKVVTLWHFLDDCLFPKKRLNFFTGYFTVMERAFSFVINHCKKENMMESNAKLKMFYLVDVAFSIDKIYQAERALCN